MNAPPLEVWEKCATMLWRVKVPGGWIYRTTDHAEGTPAIMFVPVPVEPLAPLGDLCDDCGKVWHPDPCR